MLIILKSQRNDHHYSSERKKTNRRVKDSQHNVMVSRIATFPDLYFTQFVSNGYVDISLNHWSWMKKFNENRRKMLNDDGKNIVIKIRTKICVWVSGFTQLKNRNLCGFTFLRNNSRSLASCSSRPMEISFKVPQYLIIYSCFPGGEASTASWILDITPCFYASVCSH